MTNGVGIPRSLSRGDDMKGFLLGTGMPTPNPFRAGPAVLIQAAGEKFLVDCGRWVTLRLVQLQIPLKDIRQILFTHHHSDHNVAFYDVMVTGWMAGREVPAQIYGPQGTREFVSLILKAYQHDIHVRRDLVERWPGGGIEVETHEVEEGAVYQRNGLTITAFPVDHRPFAPALGYRFDFQGKAIVLSGDTRPCPKLVEMARGADVLVHEVYQERYREERARLHPETAARGLAVQSYHTTTLEAAQVAAAAGVGKLVLTHFVPPPTDDEEDYIVGMKAIYRGPIVMGKDLMEF